MYFYSKELLFPAFRPIYGAQTESKT